ncbi:hypothetical protein D3C85_1226700 [compost metagenome]
MKTTMVVLSLSLFMLALVAMMQMVDASRQMELRARFQGCDMNPYLCVPPSISFASLR